jgi:biopolymer transport protein ExbB/TolQ
MDYGFVLGALHQFVGWLLYPVIGALALALALTVWELGQSISECFYTLPAFSAQACEQTQKRFQDHASRRLETTDLLARSGPILGLMGTLIPLGPGLTALGTGNIDILATALTVAFDTTVVGLLIGLMAYAIGRLRRRWYEQTWQAMSEAIEADNHAQ